MSNRTFDTTSTRAPFRPGFIAVATALLLVSVLTARPTAVSDQVYFSATTNVTNILVNYINQETVRLDISSWYLSEHSISIAIANRWAAGVPVRIIGDRGAIFEADPHTKAEFYWLASQGIPIRLRFNPTWFPEIDHWKAAIFVGQNVVEFGSGNFAPTELAPFSATNFDDESELFTSDPQLVGAFKTKFDVMWNDTTVEPESIVGGPPYLKSWDDACANEPTGNCADYATQYPNRVPMVVNTARLEPDNPTPPDLIWGQGPDFNNRLVQEINAETHEVDLVVYRLEVDNITQALLQKFQSGIPVRLIVDTAQYTNRVYPEYWLTHANIDKLWAAGVPILQRTHAGVTHMKTLITSKYATNGSSNFGANWQRDHDYFVSATTKPAIYQAFVDRWAAMWNDTTNFGPLVTTPPDSAALAAPASGASNVPVNTTLVWNNADFAVSYDVYLGTSSASMNLVANVPAQMVQDPPSTYAWTPPTLQSGTTYYWKIVSRTNATPVNPTMIATSSIQSFTTMGGTQPPLPSPWQNQDVGATGQPGSSSASGGVFTVVGAGADIWGTADAFQFAYQPLAGDGSIAARVASVQNTNAAAKAGVMLRGTTAAGSADVILDVEPGGNIEFMTRTADGGSTSWLAGATDAPPVWLRLVRAGSTVTGSVSADGSSWTTVGTATLSLPATALAGLAVSSHSTSQLNSSTFDNITVTGSGGGAAPGTPASPSPADGATGVSLSPTLTWSAAGATSYDVRFGTASSPPQASSGQSAATYAPGALAAGTHYFWQIVAHNASGATTGPVWSFTTGTSASPGEVVIYASDVPAGSIHGSWSASGDATAAGGTALTTPDNGVANTSGPLAAPADYVDVSFTAQANTPYTLWMRLRALNNSKLNDAVYVQFSDAQVNGASIYPIGSTSGLTVNLASDTTGASDQGWGWVNGAYWLSQTATFRFPTSGTHTLRVQVREDGVAWDQIVLSPAAYLSPGASCPTACAGAPGPISNDTTIVPKPGPPTPPGQPGSPNPADGAAAAVTSPTLSWTSSGATSYDVRFGTSSSPPQVSTGQSPASFSPGSLATGTQYFWQIVAHNAAGTTTGAVWSFTTASSSTPPDIVIYAGDVPSGSIHGSWAKSADATAAAGTLLATPDNGVANTGGPLAAPADYVDVTFTATANLPYTLWLRLRALNDSKFNDAVFVQFSDAQQLDHSPIYAIGSTSGLTVNLATDTTGVSDQGWGWVNGAYWLSQPATFMFPTSGTHTVRIQVREDGVQWDQIVLSPQTYLNPSASCPTTCAGAPGPFSNDTTIVPKR